MVPDCKPVQKWNGRALGEEGPRGGSSGAAGEGAMNKINTPVIEGGTCRANSRRGTTSPYKRSYPPVQSVRRALNVLTTLNRLRIASIRERLAAVFRDWEARTARCLRAARAAGEIAADLDCDRIAKFFWIGWEGAVLRAKLERSPAPLDAFFEGFLALLHMGSTVSGRQPACSGQF